MDAHARPSALLENGGALVVFVKRTRRTSAADERVYNAYAALTEALGAEWPRPALS